MDEHTTNDGQTLYWDASFAIARQLAQRYPDVDLEQVTLSMIEGWVLALPNFADDPDLVNDQLLGAIYQDWYEEVNLV